MQRIFNACFLGLLAILPMSNTIALRNLLLLVLVCLVLFFLCFRRGQLALPLGKAWKKVPSVVLVWVVFLFLFPLWAVQGSVAWENLAGQWVESLLAGFVGAGAVLLLGQHGPSLWLLALASSFSLGLQLLLSLAALGGLLSADFYADPNFATVWGSFLQLKSAGVGPVWHWQNFLTGFRGIEPMHGNLGYAACQAIVLLSVCFLMAWRGQNKKIMFASGAIAGLCFLSILIAHSRGAILYGLLILAASALAYAWKMRVPLAITSARSRTLRSLLSRSFIGVALSVFVFIGLQSVRHDERWFSMVDKVELGLLSDEPLRLLCEGISSESEARIREKFSHGDPAYAQVLLDGLKLQDGGRILLMRAGFDLALENPRGFDGSRHSYRKLIEQKCGHVPALQFAHSHQGWIDLSLALGWTGLLIFGLMMACFLCIGWRQMEDQVLSSWAMALFLISGFWILRGFADSVYREHYLQMQMLLLTYLYGRLVLASSTVENLSTTLDQQTVR
ncbi:MAG: hypothetical protein A3I66_17950 [Burkholderiales bacterium RIFCSPLOWO2_02_FULL_57_36]|nr:MAG: hypothetical protein A3I66_17950 [Burkholderiales bacterium RIFCSPLOWO2_02_FULL_57_36]